MAAAAIFEFEKLLPFHYLLIDHHQICCTYCDVDLELIDDVGHVVAEIQIEFRKTVAISLLFLTNHRQI